MSRIVAPSHIENLTGSQHVTASKLHDHTYGKRFDDVVMLSRYCQMPAPMTDSHAIPFGYLKHSGITSDPLTQFACAFSALIHDVGKSSRAHTPLVHISSRRALTEVTGASLDHVGVSNAQLIKEGVPIAAKYNQRSVAEQNSLDLSWDLLMQDRYLDLRKYLFSTQADLIRFRQLVVNVSALSMHIH